jgi:hypothetical protein
MEPEYVPAPAIMRSLDSVSTPMRSRCCISITSGCAANMPWAGSISANVAAVTTTMMPTAISVSIMLNPASPRARLERFVIALSLS